MIVAVGFWRFHKTVDGSSHMHTPTRGVCIRLAVVLSTYSNYINTIHRRLLCKIIFDSKSVRPKEIGRGQTDEETLLLVIKIFSR